MNFALYNVLLDRALRRFSLHHGYVLSDGGDESGYTLLSHVIYEEARFIPGFPKRKRPVAIITQEPPDCMYPGYSLVLPNESGIGITILDQRYTDMLLSIHTRIQRVLYAARILGPGFSNTSTIPKKYVFECRK